jgi:hypothetical protein
MPYLNRLNKPFYIQIHNSLLKPYKRQKLHKTYGGPEAPLRVLLWDSKEGMDESFEAAYAQLEPGGLVFFLDVGGYKNEILNWRLANRHSPPIHNMDGPEDTRIWFWNKPVPFTETVEEEPVRKKTYEIIEPPSPGEGHLTTNLLKKYATGDVFFETGTYFGTGVETAINSDMFKEVYSVELDSDLAERAEKIYEKQAIILNGDSPSAIQFIGETYPEGTEPVVATFWLDAHASGILPGGEAGGTPVVEELKAIRDHWYNLSTIMIDDVRLFGSPEWSGVTLNDALAIINEINPDYKIVYEDGEVPADILIAYMEK